MGIAPCMLALVAMMAEPTDAAPPLGDLQALQGAWKCTTCVRAGESDSKTVGVKVKIERDRLTFQFDRERQTCRIQLQEDTSPKRIVWRQVWMKGLELEIEFQGLYLLAGDTLLICLPEQSSRPRPTYFGSSKTDGLSLFLLQRASAEP